MKEIQKLLGAAVKTACDQEVEVSLTRPEPQFGDFATNVALQLGKQLGSNPREVAEKIIDELSENSIIAKAEIAGPGFINLSLTAEALLTSAAQPPAQSLKGQTVVVEYSDPNPLKPLHAGHLYTTLVGDSIARLLEAAGGKVVRLNYGGDVGRHIGITMWAILRELGGEQPDKLETIEQSERPAWLGARYVEGTAAFENDPAAKNEITALNKRVYQLHAEGDRDSAFAHIYWTVRQWSYDYFKLLYEQMQIVPFDRYIPESEVTPLGLATVREQLDKGVYETSEGAVVFKGEQYGLHTRVFINSEGLPTYEAKDVGLLLTKWNDYHFDRSLVITANEQAQYFEVMLKSVEQFKPEPVKRSHHLTHGVVKLQGGVKMSSRRGNIVSALDILDAARTAGEKSGVTHSDDSILAAVKYAFAKNRIGGDIIYDSEESVSLEGNSGPYLQYAHARACSILQKTTVTPREPSELQGDERALLRKISEYSEVIERATQELMPHHICAYLYELAQGFNRFYERNRVIGDAREAERLYLVGLYRRTLQQGLMLLGIPAPEKM